jgi:hypothetical protein
MKEEMRNFPGPRRIIVQQIQQRWSFCDQSPSGRLLVVEHDYLLDLEVFFLVMLYPMNTVHPSTQGVAGGDCPPCGVRGFGGEAPEGKIALKIYIVISYSILTVHH